MDRPRPKHDDNEQIDWSTVDGADMTSDEKVAWIREYENAFFASSNSAPPPDFASEWLKGFENDGVVCDPSEAADEDIYALSS